MSSKLRAEHLHLLATCIIVAALLLHWSVSGRHPVNAADGALDNFPIGPIEVINNSNPGGGSDTFLRLATASLGDQFDTAIIHLSKTGGVATNTLRYVETQPADGQTLFIINSGTLLTVRKGTTHLSVGDIQPLVRGTLDPHFLVARTGRFASADDFLNQARSRRIAHGGTSIGGDPHAASMLLRNALGMKRQVYVPFNNSGEILINLVNGNLDTGLLNFNEFAVQWEAGEVEPLMVFSRSRLAAAPGVPTSLESGLDLELVVVRGIGVRKGTPAPVVNRLEAALLESLHAPAFQQYLARTGQTPESVAGSEEFTAQLERMNDAYISIADELGLHTTAPQ